MSEYSKSLGILRTSATVVVDALESNKQAAEEPARADEPIYSATVEIMRDLCLQLIDMAQANALATFDFAREIVNAHGPGDIIVSCTAHAQKQVELLRAQSNELTAHVRKIASENVAPNGHNIN